MKAADLVLSTRNLSNLDLSDQARATFRAAYGMARRMVRDRARHGAGAAWTWYLDHARRRFGASGWRVAQAAGRLAFDRRTVGHAASGSVADLERQGLVRRTARPRPGNLVGVVAYRCAAFERVRPQGINLAWTFDPLASASNRALRAHRARRRRLVAQAMAEDRRALAPVPPGGKPDPRDRFALTPAGRTALAAAEAHADL